MATGLCWCLIKLPSKVFDDMFLVVVADPFFNRHDADKTMVSLCLNDIKSTQEQLAFLGPPCPFPGKGLS
jgi:hypothetical protein